MTAPAKDKSALAEMHVAASQRYAEAAQDFGDAWAEVLGVGIAASNRNVDAISENERISPVEPRMPLHPPYLSSVLNPDVLRQRAHQRAMDLLASLELN